MAVLIMVAVLKQRKTKSSQYRFLRSHQRPLLAWLSVDRFPSRTTYFDRYRRAWRLYEQAIRIGHSRWLDECSLCRRRSEHREGPGPRWNKRQVARGRIPSGADLDATWTYSEYHGWILGYSYEVVVTAEKNGTVWPLLASADPAHWQPPRTFPQKIAALPDKTRYVLADAGYGSGAMRGVSSSTCSVSITAKANTMDKSNGSSTPSEFPDGLGLPSSAEAAYDVYCWTSQPCPGPFAAA